MQQRHFDRHQYFKELAKTSEKYFIPYIMQCHDICKDTAILEISCGEGGNLKDNGILFLAFPAWQMPFGGHQQICRSALLSKVPFIHLLPGAVYKHILTYAGESEEIA